MKLSVFTSLKGREALCFTLLVTHFLSLLQVAEFLNIMICCALWSASVTALEYIQFM